MFFREMEEADLSEILLLDREIFRSMAYSERDFRYAISGKYDRAILLVEEEQIIAYGILRLLGTEGELESIAVRKEYRGRGYGRLLLSEFLRLAKLAGTEKLFLEVREGNIFPKEGILSGPCGRCPSYGKDYGVNVGVKFAGNRGDDAASEEMADEPYGAL